MWRLAEPGCHKAPPGEKKSKGGKLNWTVDAVARREADVVTEMMLAQQESCRCYRSLP